MATNNPFADEPRLDCGDILVEVWMHDEFGYEWFELLTLKQAQNLRSEAVRPTESALAQFSPDELADYVRVQAEYDAWRQRLRAELDD